MAPEAHSDALVALLEQFAQLKQSYERFWQGLERPEPERERLALRSQFARLRAEAEAQNNVAASFRLRSAQQSFLTFDQLCERRARAQLERRFGPTRNVSAAPPAPPPRPIVQAATAPSGDGLYKELQAALAERGLPAPSAEKFQRQLEAALSAAQQRAPGQSLRAQLRFDAQHRVQLVIVPVSA